MTDTHDKVRGLFLAALMVMSVFAGTIAFSGGAAAQAANEDPEIVSAVEYDGNIEVVFSDEVQDNDTNGALDGDSFDVEVGDTSYDATIDTDSNPRYILSGGWGDLNPTDDVTVTANDIQASVGGGPAVDEIEEDVDVTSVVMDSSETAHDSRSEADSIFAGEVIAVQSTSGDGYEVRDLTDSNAIQGGSLGDNATTFAFETEDLDTGNSYRISFTNGANDKFFNITDLGLTASADDVNTEEDLEVDIEATWGNRPVTAELVDEDETRSATLNGQGEATVNFGSLDAGNYTVNVTDDQSGIEVTTGTIEVVEAGDEDASFGEDAYVADEVGDVAEIPVQLDNTDTADVRIGTMNDGYVINATVEDEGDGEVTLLFNSFTAGSYNGGDNTVLSVDTEDESDEITSIEEDGDFANNEGAEPGENLLDSAQYEMVVETNAGDDLGTLDLNDRSTGNMSIWTAPEDESVNDWGAADYWNNEGSSVTETDAVATEDYAVHAIEATGLEGAFEYYDGEEADLLANETLFNLTVEQTNPGPNRDAKELLFDGAATIQPDAANDTYFVAVDMGDASTDERTLDTGDEYQANFTVNSEDVLDAGGDDASGTYEVVERNGELDTTDSQVFVQAASSQEISGSTTIAPGSDVTVRVTSSDADSPFRFNPSATVNPDGTFNVSIDFSDEDTGTNFTASVIDPYTNSAFDDADGVEGQISDEAPTPSPTPADGNATETPTDGGDATATETDGMTPTPTDTPTGPGFTALVAIIAMLGAALLAARRSA